MGLWKAFFEGLATLLVGWNERSGEWAGKLGEDAVSLLCLGLDVGRDRLVWKIRNT